MFGKRLFTLGCSYTSYWYPTWADWLGSEFNYYENLGISGLGNRGIFNRLSELIYRRKINENDCVVIAWSIPTREDRYFSGKGWEASGNIYNQAFYSEEFIKKYYDPFMGLMETINYINAASLMLSATKCKFAMTFMKRPDIVGVELQSVLKKRNVETYLELCDPEKKLQGYLDYVLSDEHMIDIDIDNFCKEYSLTNKIPCPTHGLRNDSHPNPLSHYFYTKNVISKHFGYDHFDDSGKMLDLAHKWSTFSSNFPRMLEPLWPKNNNSALTELSFL